MISDTCLSWTFMSISGSRNLSSKIFLILTLRQKQPSHPFLKANSDKLRKIIKVVNYLNYVFKKSIIHYVFFWILFYDCLERAETVRSIVTQEYQKFIKSNYKSSHSSENRRKLFQNFVSSIHDGAKPGIIINLAKQNKTSPALVAKIILEEYLKVKISFINYSA